MYGIVKQLPLKKRKQGGGSAGYALIGCLSPSPDVIVLCSEKISLVKKKIEKKKKICVLEVRIV